jgi:hypothetical protein
MTKLSDEDIEHLIKKAWEAHWPFLVDALQELQVLRAKPMALSIEQWRQIRQALELSTAKYDNKGKSFSCDETWAALKLMDSIEAGKE